MKGFPKTFRPLDSDGALNRPQVFEPALVHYANAFRLGDPTFASPELGERWFAARRRALYHVLAVVATSPFRDHLVLRGSMLLRAWLGPLAREPGDMDWVVTPAAVKVTDRWATHMLDRVPRLVVRAPGPEGVRFDPGGVTVDAIWTYDRAPGRRVVLRWSGDGLPDGTVQLDFVFGEELWAPPTKVNVRTGDGSLEWVSAAGMELSLAWKLLWLETDAHPQGKDLYDAVLLAERTTLPLDVLRKVIESAVEPRWRPELTPNLPFRWEVDWENFKTEYPWVQGEAKDWQARLACALGKSFAEASRR